MLKDINKYDCTYYHKLNLFKISEVMLYGYIFNAINEPVKCDEIIPVPIDGIHDRNIIFRTSTVAYMTTAGEAHINTSHKDEDSGDTIYDYPDLNGNIKTLEELVKRYYNATIVPILKDYEFLK